MNVATESVPKAVQFNVSCIKIEAMISGEADSLNDMLTYLHKHLDIKSIDWDGLGDFPQHATITTRGGLEHQLIFTEADQELPNPELELTPAQAPVSEPKVKSAWLWPVGYLTVVGVLIGLRLYFLN